jgi:hypothetical protein
MPDTTTTEPTMLFALGRVMQTPGARAELENLQVDPVGLLTRHATGDWGNLTEDDIEANNHAVDNEERILSAYQLNDTTRIWIITEWDRETTTILLPDEY